MGMNMQDLIEGFRTVAIASVSDAVDRLCGRHGYMHSSIKARTGDSRVVGPAATVLEAPTDQFVPPQHMLDLIDEVPPGSVIVVSIAGGDSEVAVWGALMTAGAFANGHAGAIVDAGVRDIAEIRRDYGFPVYARSVSPGTTLGRYRTVASQVPVNVGDVMVSPGDLIVADIDGVVVVPKDRAAAVLAMAREIDARELAQARLVVAERSMRKGLAKYART